MSDHENDLPASTGLTRLPRSEREALHEHQQPGERERRDESIGAPSFRGELAGCDE